MLVSDKNPLDERCISAGVCKTAEGLAGGEPRVDEQRTPLASQIGAVSLAPARKDGQFHCRNDGPCGYLRAWRGPSRHEGHPPVPRAALAGGDPGGYGTLWDSPRRPGSGRAPGAGRGSLRTAGPLRRPEGPPARPARGFTPLRCHHRIAGPNEGVHIPFRCPRELDPVEVELAGDLRHSPPGSSGGGWTATLSGCGSTSRRGNTYRGCRQAVGTGRRGAGTQPAGC